MADERRTSPTRFDALPDLDFFRDWPRVPLRLARFFDDSPAAGRRESWSPAVDIHENDDGYIVSVELPGAAKEDVSVECEGNVLSIKGQKRSEREEKREHTHLIERCYGSFSRSFTLPKDADPEQVRASFKDGVLTVEIPKSEAQKPRVVSIQS